MRKTFRFRTRRARPDVALPSRPSLAGPEPERLMGEVQGMKASAPEERLARALDKAGISYQFRYTVGAPRGLPGWKEVDFIVPHKGLLYTVEVDTAFTHRDKKYSDRLHDEIILMDEELRTMGQLYPEVFHVDGDTDLANFANATAYVKRQFGA